MTMNAQTMWIYTEYFQTSRDYVLHLQQLGVLLITAIAIVFYNNAASKSKLFLFLIGFAFVISIINLIIGLTMYGGLLGLTLDFSLKIPDLTSIKCGIYSQFGLELLILFLLFFAVITQKRFQDKK